MKHLDSSVLEMRDWNNSLHPAHHLMKHLDSSVLELRDWNNIVHPAQHLMSYLDSSVLKWRAWKYCIHQAIAYRSSSRHFSEYQYEPEDKWWIQLQICLQHIPVNTTHYESEDDDGFNHRYTKTHHEWVEINSGSDNKLLKYFHQYQPHWRQLLKRNLE